MIIFSLLIDAKMPCSRHFLVTGHCIKYADTVEDGSSLSFQRPRASALGKLKHKDEWKLTKT